MNTYYLKKYDLWQDLRMIVLLEKLLWCEKFDKQK